MFSVLFSAIIQITNDDITSFLVQCVRNLMINTFVEPLLTDTVSKE